MTYLPDGTLDHLRRVTEIPDLSGTRYELEGELGRGGMAVVYRARDTRLARSVALKVMDDGRLASEEACLIAQLEHPGVVPLYDAGTLPDGRFYYAMKLVEGLRLDAYLAQRPALAARLRLFQKICEAVAFAHSRGAIHRDLKPQNIMVGAFGEALVMDWGVSGVAGTPRYIAPERASGNVGTRADIFSLGVLLADVIDPEHPRPLEAIARKAQAADPKDRYDDVQELAADLTRFMDGLPVSAYRERPWESLARFIRRNRMLLLLLAAYLAVRIFLFALR